MKLSIPTPCSENFNNFDPTEKGGFCKNCQKEVIDFTKMNKAEIKDYFYNANDKVCGRLPKKQVDMRPLKTGKIKNGLITASVSLFSIFFSNQISAQQNKKPTIEQLTNIATKQFDTKSVAIPKVTITKNDSLPLINDGIIELRGTVLYLDYDDPLIGANIVQIGTNNGIATDIDGNFKLLIDASTIEDSIQLEVQYLGFPNKQLSILPNKRKIDLGEIFMESDGMLTGEVCIIGTVVGYKKFSVKRMWYRTKNFFRRIF